MGETMGTFTIGDHCRQFAPMKSSKEMFLRVRKLPTLSIRSALVP